MIDIVYKYQSLLENIDTLVEQSSYKKEHIFTKLNLSRQTFYLKLKNKNFSVTEMLKLTTILFPEEAKTIEIKQSIERGIKDVEEEKVKPHSEIMIDAMKMINQWK